MKGKKPIDLTGKKFGKLKVVKKDEEYSKKYKGGCCYWECKCDCGETKSVRSDVLRKGISKSCGCTLNHVKIGDKIGKLTVTKKLGKIHPRKNNKGRGNSIYWECKCDCGSNKIIILSSHSIREGNHKSCGCLLNPKGDKHPCYTGYKKLSGRFFNRIKVGAEKRGLEFNVTKEQLWELFKKQNKKCALSGVKLQFGIESKNKVKKKECTISLDRIDNDKGYIINNIQWIHKDINRMKNYFSQEYFLEICEKITKNLNLEKKNENKRVNNKVKRISRRYGSMGL